MGSTQVKIDIAEADEQGTLVIPPEIANEMGVHVGDRLTLEVVAGTLVIRLESRFALAKGAGAPWRVYPPLTPEEEAEAFALAIAEDNARYE
jgi:antitoxin component of MazEF toxin-antitoxin module